MFTNIKKAVRTIKRINEKKLNFLIFFVTSTCNSRCRSCFFWQNLNQNNDLDLESIDKASKSAGQFNTLLLSGGEPFLRKELPEIIKIFSKNNAIKNVGIPTNSLLGEPIPETVKKLVAENPEITFDINLSLDGLEPDHDYIRNVPGNFQKVMQVLKALGELKKTGLKFNIIINSIICKRNYDSLLDLAEFIYKNHGDYVDMHVFEIIRGDAKEKSEKELSTEQVKSIFNKLFKFQVEHYLNRNPDFVKRVLSIGSLSTKYNLQYRGFQFKPWGISCPAGSTNAVISPEGKLSYCELKPELGSLKENGFNIKEMLSRFSEIIKTRIKKEKCYCTHICFVNEAIWHSFYAVFVMIPFNFIKWLIFKKTI